MALIDWIIIGVFFVIVLGIGWVASRKSGKDTKEFFLGGGKMPWWLLGISMVACTFSADTPNLVTGLIRESGISKNWVWWAFLITGMVTVFIYARLWRRSEVLTDLEFYELRYGGKPAEVLRVFRSIYLGVFFNCLIMGTVTLAAIKIGEVMFGLLPWVTVVGASICVVLYASLGGLRGVVWADFFQYFIAMFGAVVAAYYALLQPEVGGISGLLSQLDARTLGLLPDFSSWSTLIPLFIIPIAVQWWAVWYPGAEPGGGGYIAQRMLAAKDEKNAIGATLLFNFMHYALRPWPWIIVGLASMLVFPTLSDIQEFLPGISQKYLKDDIAYPVMIKKTLPIGFLGLVVASLIAAYMSTIGTHLNWGASYFVNDFYGRIVKPPITDSEEEEQKRQKQLVVVGRICTVVLMVLSGTISLTFLDNATQAFDILLLSGAGTGAIYLLRWFWKRINAWTEITAMVVATIVAIVLVFVVEKQGIQEIILSVADSEDIYQIDDADCLSYVVSYKDIIDVEKERLVNGMDDISKAIKENKSEVLYSQIANLMQQKQALEVPNYSIEHYLKTNTPAWEQKYRASIANIEKEGGVVKVLMTEDRLYIYSSMYDNWIFPVQLLIALFLVTASWLAVTLLTKPERQEVLDRFYSKIHPNGINKRNLGIQILLVFIGALTIYCFLFGIGAVIFGSILQAVITFTIGTIGTLLIFKLL